MEGKPTYGYNGSLENDVPDWNYPGLTVAVWTGTHHHNYSGLTAGVILTAIKNAEADEDEEKLESILKDPYTIIDNFYRFFGS